MNVIRSALIAILSVCALPVAAQENAAPSETDIELRADPLVDLYQQVRALATSKQEVEVSESLVEAVQIGRTLNATLQRTLAWSVLDGRLPGCESAADLVQRFEALSEPETLRGGFQVSIRDDAIALAKALQKIQAAFVRDEWPARKSRIDEAIKRIQKDFAGKERQCFAYMLQSLGMKDPKLRIPVYMVNDGPWPGAVTFATPDGHGVCFVAIDAAKGTQLIETILHEATHALDVQSENSDDVFTRLRNELEKQGKTFRDPVMRDAPHAVMFIQAGETIRRLVHPDHVHYGDDGLYDRIPNARRIKEIWIDYLDGKITREQAESRIIETVTADKPAEKQDAGG